MTAQKYGAGDLGAMRKTVASAAILSLVCIGSDDSRECYIYEESPAFDEYAGRYFDYAYEYIVIICTRILPRYSNLLSSVLCSFMNNQTPLYFLILAALLNVVLDLVFIVCFHMGPAGAAYATVIAIRGYPEQHVCFTSGKQFHSFIFKGDWKVEGSLLKPRCGLDFHGAAIFYNSDWNHDGTVCF